MDNAKVSSSMDKVSTQTETAVPVEEPGRATVEGSKPKDDQLNEKETETIANSSADNDKPNVGSPLGAVHTTGGDVEEKMMAKGVLLQTENNRQSGDVEERMRQKGMLHPVVQTALTALELNETINAAQPEAVPPHPRIPADAHPGAFPVRGIDARNVDRSDYLGVDNAVDNRGLTNDSSVALDVNDNEPGATAAPTSSNQNFRDGLAVAAPVDEEEVNELPQAQEMTDKPPAARKNVPLGIILIIAGVLFIVGLPLIIVSVVSKSDKEEEITDTTIAPTTLSPTASPSAAPSLSPEALFFSYLPYESPDEIQSGSAQAEAYDWVLKDPNFEEYLMEGGWRAVQRYALATLYHATGGDSWANNTNWLSYDVSECEWFANDDWGIEKDERRQREFLNAIYTFPDGPCGEETSEYHYILLGFSGLDGSLPEELYLMTNLRWLYIIANSLTGTISTSIGKLTHLTAFGIPANGFSGTLPTELGLLTDMKGMFIFRNKFSGPIPSELGLVTALNGMVFDNNELNGPIPQQLMQLPALYLLHAHTNKLSGELPNISQLSNSLMSFEVYENSLTGMISSEIALIPRLTSLRVNENLLTGTLPVELFPSLRHMQSFRVSENSLSGTVPTEVGLWKNLGNLWLQDNSLTGNLPSEIGLIQDEYFERLSITNNNFSGSFPQEVFDLTQWGLEVLEISGNPLLSGVVPWDVCNISGRVVFTCPSLMCGCDCPCPDGTNMDASETIPEYTCRNMSNSRIRCEVP